MRSTILITHPSNSRAAVLSLCALLLLAAGCTRYNYTVEMHPAADGKLARSLRFQPHGRNIKTEDDAEIRRLAASYGAEVPIGADVAVSFAGTFADVMPQDIGGAGRYSHWDSPLGSVRIYAERFRGNDDLDTLLRVRRQTVDHLADLIVGWFESEMSDDPQWPALRAFLDQPFRNDLQNLSLLALAFNGVWEREPDVVESVEVEIGLRAAHYFIERGYVSYDQFPAFLAHFEDMMHKDDFTGILAQVRGMVLRRLGERGASDQTAGPRFLADPQSVAASWQRYFVTTDYFRQQLEDFDNRHEEDLTNAGSQRSEKRIIGMTSELLQAALSPWGDNSPTGDHDRLNLTLSVEQPPSWTNGKWDADRQRIEWARSLPTTDDLPALTSWPAFCYAIWMEPDFEAQTRLFGKVALVDRKLFDYALWYAALTPRERQEWDGLVSSLRPDEEWTTPLSQFRFSDEPEGIKLDDRRASSAIDLLNEAHAAATSTQEK